MDGRVLRESGNELPHSRSVGVAVAESGGVILGKRPFARVRDQTSPHGIQFHVSRRSDQEERLLPAFAALRYVVGKARDDRPA